jgi:hypothetical protein
MGMSEATDTLILSVSEETGQISIIRNGRIDSNLSIPEIRKRIIAYLSDTENVKREVEEESNTEVAS